MERRASEGGLIVPGFVRHGFTFRTATPDDDRAIANLINANAIPGWVELAYETELGMHAPLRTAIVHGSMVGVRNRDGRFAGIASRAVHPGFVDGVPQPVGWLGQWRIEPDFRHRPHLLRSEFEATRRLLHDARETPWYLASVISDNDVARRLVEANLQGFPHFTRLFGITTLAIRSRHATRESGALRHGRSEDMPAVAAFINAENEGRQFAPRVQAAEFQTVDSWPGLAPEDFLIAERGDTICGVVAVWDQSFARRMVVRRYAPFLSRLRGLVNLVAPIAGIPHLPPAGAALRAVYAALLTVAGGDASVAIALVNAALTEAASRGAAMALLGLTEQDPLLLPLRKSFRHLSYASVIYRVAWPDDAGRCGPLDARIPKIEIALL